MDDVSVLTLQNLEVIRIIEEPAPEGEQDPENPVPRNRALILKAEPQDLSASGIILPIEASRTVRRCLEKSPDARFQSASDLAYNLRSITSEHGIPSGTTPQPLPTKKRRFAAAVLAVATLAIITGVTAFFTLIGDSSPPVSNGLPRVAVLPFENLGPADDEYFADGMTEEVRGKLAGLAGLEVIARGSSDFYRDTTKTTRQIADELGVRYLLTATVRWQRSDDGPSRIRLSSELVDAQPGQSPVAMWHDSFDATLADVFEVQADIATKVVSALGVALGAQDQESLVQRPTDNLEAYELYMQAERISREALGGSLVRSSRVADLYQQAIDLDPNFASAWAGLSMAQSRLFRLFKGTQDQADAARNSAERALELDPTLPYVRLAMSRYFNEVRQDSKSAKEQIDIGLRDSPNHADLIREQARLLRYDRNRWEEALVGLQRSAALDPLSSRAAADLGWHLLYMRRLGDAEEALNRALSISPENMRAIRHRAMAMLARGDLDEARAFLRDAAEPLDLDEFIAHLAVWDDLFWVLDDDWQLRLLEFDLEPFGGYETDRSIAFAHTYYLRGDLENAAVFAENARTELAEQLEEFPDDPDANPLMGVALAYLGQRDAAIEFGRKGVELYETRPGVPYPYSQLQLVRIHTILGQAEPALDNLEPLLEVPFYITPGWLRIDPMFDPLREHPRFHALVE
jgi:TolB-like protein/tetratricopeptide (TPR) repeat protein